jgi:hypothetical protein
VGWVHHQQGARVDNANNMGTNLLIPIRTSQSNFYGTYYFAFLSGDGVCIRAKWPNDCMRRAGQVNLYIFKNFGFSLKKEKLGKAMCGSFWLILYSVHSKKQV